MKKIVFALVALAIAAPAWAQNAVTQSGSIVVNQPLRWARDRSANTTGGLTGDSLGQGFAPFSSTDSLGLAWCSNSARTTGQYNALCFGHDSSGNGLITLDSYAGYASKALKFRINGASYDFPGSGSGNVVGPGSSTVNSVAFFNNTTGTLLSDLGFAYDGTRLSAPLNKTYTTSGTGTFQVGGTTGPYIFNDTAADTVSVQAQSGALPSGNTTNFQIYPPAVGQKAYLNIAKVYTGGNEERLILGHDGTSYRLSQVLAGTGACRNLDFIDGQSAVPAFTMVCGGGSVPSLRLGKGGGLLGDTTSFGSLALLRLEDDSTPVLRIAEGANIPAIAFYKPLLSVAATPPTVSGCGTGASISGGTDTKGIILVGTGTVTACTVTFASTYTSIPAIVLTGQGTGSIILSLSASSGSAFTIAGSANFASTSIHYHVIQ